MPSNALTGHLLPLLMDADYLIDARDQMHAGDAGRTARSAALNRAVVVMCASAWEAYLEALVRESLQVLRPPAPPLGMWPAMNATVLGWLGRFNNPNVENTRQLLSDSIGLQEIHLPWTWQNSTSAQAVERLAVAMRLRHQVAHGVNPRPVVNSYYAGQLANFYRRLGRATDRAVRLHLVNTLGIPALSPA